MLSSLLDEQQHATSVFENGGAGSRSGPESLLMTRPVQRVDGDALTVLTRNVPFQLKKDGAGGRSGPDL